MWIITTTITKEKYMFKTVFTNNTSSFIDDALRMVKEVNELKDFPNSFDDCRPMTLQYQKFPPHVNRPYNLYAVRSGEGLGHVTSYVFETVYTPFKPSDIKCEYTNTHEDGQIFTITVGNIKPKTTDECNTQSNSTKTTEIEHIQHGISNRGFVVTLPLVGIGVKPADIVVTAVDGMLKVVIPVDRSADDIVSVPINVK